MSRPDEYLNIISEIIFKLIILRKDLSRRSPDIFLSEKDYEVLNTIRILLSELEELDTI